MAELRSNARVQLMLFDRLDQRLSIGIAGNGEGLTLNNLIGGQTYQIHVEYYSGLSPYDLIIGHQKETVDISGISRLSDSIQYTSQRNAYTFTAPRNGMYRFEMAELRANARVRLTLLNSLDARLSVDIAGNGEGLTFNNIIGGQAYQIFVEHYSGLSPYNMIVSRQ